MEIRVGQTDPTRNGTLTASVYERAGPIEGTGVDEDFAQTCVDVPRPIYLDHHATTPVDPRVARAVLHAMTDAFGNANSVDHIFGETAAAMVDKARNSVAHLVGADPTDIRFTSGATEAIE